MIYQTVLPVIAPLLSKRGFQAAGGLVTNDPKSRLEDGKEAIF
jgi:hypothetical protein